MKRKDKVEAEVMEQAFEEVNVESGSKPKWYQTKKAKVAGLSVGTIGLGFVANKVRNYVLHRNSELEDGYDADLEGTGDETAFDDGTTSAE